MNISSSMDEFKKLKDKFNDLQSSEDNIRNVKNGKGLKEMLDQQFEVLIKTIKLLDVATEHEIKKILDQVSEQVLHIVGHPTSYLQDIYKGDTSGNISQSGKDNIKKQMEEFYNEGFSEVWKLIKKVEKKKKIFDMLQRREEKKTKDLEIDLKENQKKLEFSKSEKERKELQLEIERIKLELECLNPRKALLDLKKEFICSYHEFLFITNDESYKKYAETFSNQSITEVTDKFNKLLERGGGDFLSRAEIKLYLEEIKKDEQKLLQKTKEKGMHRSSTSIFSIFRFGSSRALSKSRSQTNLPAHGRALTTFQSELSLLGHEAMMTPTAPASISPSASVNSPNNDRILNTVSSAPISQTATPMPSHRNARTELMSPLSDTAVEKRFTFTNAMMNKKVPDIPAAVPNVSEVPPPPPVITGEIKNKNVPSMSTTPNNEPKR